MLCVPVGKGVGRNIGRTFGTQGFSGAVAKRSGLCTPPAKEPPLSATVRLSRQLKFAAELGTAEFMSGICKEQGKRAKVGGVGRHPLLALLSGRLLPNLRLRHLYRSCFLFNLVTLDLLLVRTANKPTQ